MTTDYTPRVAHHLAADNAADAAQVAQLALLEAHQYVSDFRPDWARTCSCGRVFGTTNGLGLHRGAVRKAADKLWDETYEAAMVAAGY